MRAAHSAVGWRRSSWLILLLALVLGIVLAGSGLETAADRALMPLRFAAAGRDASGKVAIVEMDADSAATIRRWPWSRAHYAPVVDRLRRAGAASIVFDVEFSSAGDEAGDRAFAAALARAGGLVALPTFGQSAGSHDRRTIDALPIPLLRDHVALASVSIAPDADGQVRTMPFGTVTAGTPRPSLSAFIAGRSGVAGHDFPVDFSIDPTSIPRLSFVAVRDGRFDPSAVRGRNVLIGATAIEMGDRFATPRWGIVPGVVVQALAAETLLHGVPAYGWSPLMTLVATLVVAAMVACRTTVRSVVVAVVAAGAIMAGALIAQHRFLVTYPIAVALAQIAAATGACLVRDVAGRFRTQRTIDEATGLGNARALLQPCKDQGAAILAVAQIGNHDTLRAVLGPRGVADMVVRVSERLALIAVEGRVYRPADHHLAFLLPADQAIDDTLHGLRAILLQPVEVGGRRVDVSVTIGVASDSRAAMERLLSDAALAADEARASEQFWSRAAPDIAGLERSISLMGELDQAIGDGDIKVFYQPKYHLRDARVTGVEALVRWRHPTRGFIGPDLFIPVAEKTNRIAPLTLHVLSQVVSDLAALRTEHPDFTAAINISAKLLSAAAFNGDVERIIAAAGIPTSALVFEVTESAAMSDAAAAVAALRRYRDLGIAVSMDDYGTGQSTLTYLRQLPLSELKIDRSFVQHAHCNRDDAVLVRSTIDLAHQLGLRVVAEGVEDADCLSFLADHDCDVVQGYFISRPLPCSELTRFLKKDDARAQALRPYLQV